MGTTGGYTVSDEKKLSYFYNLLVPPRELKFVHGHGEYQEHNTVDKKKKKLGKEGFWVDVWPYLAQLNPTTLKNYLSQKKKIEELLSKIPSLKPTKEYSQLRDRYVSEQLSDCATRIKTHPSALHRRLATEFASAGVISLTDYNPNYSLGQRILIRLEKEKLLDGLLPHQQPPRGSPESHSAQESAFKTQLEQYTNAIADMKAELKAKYNLETVLTSFQGVFNEILQCEDFLLRSYSHEHKLKLAGEFVTMTQGFLKVVDQAFYTRLYPFIHKQSQSFLPIEKIYARLEAIYNTHARGEKGVSQHPFSDYPLAYLVHSNALDMYLPPDFIAQKGVYTTYFSSAGHFYMILRKLLYKYHEMYYQLLETDKTITRTTMKIYASPFHNPSAEEYQRMEKILDGYAKLHDKYKNFHTYF